MPTVKVIEVIGASDQGWEEAVQNGVKSAARTLDNLVGVDVKSWTAKLSPDGKFLEYHATCRIAFKVIED